jgi:two-component system NtrC family response regulator
MKKSGQIIPFADYRQYVVAQAEQHYLKELLTTVESVDDACRISGLSRSRLYSLLKKHGLQSFKRPQFQLPSNPGLS